MPPRHIIAAPLRNRREKALTSATFGACEIMIYIIYLHFRRKSTRIDDCARRGLRILAFSAWEQPEFRYLLAIVVKNVAFTRYADCVEFVTPGAPTRDGNNEN